MDHLHFETEATARDLFEITVDRPANVLLLDQANYDRYCLGQEHVCFGGEAEKGSVRLKPNRPGRWHVAVDQGRSGGPVSASVKNVTTGQAVGTHQARLLKGAATGADTLEYRADRQR